MIGFSEQKCQEQKLLLFEDCFYYGGWVVCYFLLDVLLVALPTFSYYSIVVLLHVAMLAVVTTSARIFGAPLQLSP